MIDTNAHTQSFLFTLTDEKELARLLCLDRAALFHPSAPVCRLFVTFFDTADKAFGAKNYDVMRLSAGAADGTRFDGVEAYHYDTDNVWGTQAQRPVAWSSAVNAVGLVADRRLDDYLLAEGTPVREDYAEGLFEVNKTDIAVFRSTFPEIGTSYIRIGSPIGSGNNFRCVPDETFAVYDKRLQDFKCSNFLKTQLFIEQAYAAGAIQAVTQTPAAMVKKISRFG